MGALPSADHPRWNRIAVGGVDDGVYDTIGQIRAREPMDDSDAVDPRFQAFYEAQFAPTVRLARMLTGRSAVAEDLAQDAFVRLYRFVEDGERPVDNPPALLRTIVTNVCRSWHRSAHRAQLRMIRHGADEDALGPDERELDDSLRRLPYDQRAVIVLRYWLRLSEAEIADALDCRPGTVKSRHARALAALRKELS